MIVPEHSSQGESQRAQQVSRTPVHLTSCATSRSRTCQRATAVCRVPRRLSHPLPSLLLTSVHLFPDRASPAADHKPRKGPCKLSGGGKERATAHLAACPGCGDSSQGGAPGADTERKLRAASVLAEQLGKQGRGPACANSSETGSPCSSGRPLCRALNMGTELPDARGEDARTRTG